MKRVGGINPRNTTAAVKPGVGGGGVVKNGFGGCPVNERSAPAINIINGWEKPQIDSWHITDIVGIGLAIIETADLWVIIDGFKSFASIKI